MSSAYELERLSRLLDEGKLTRDEFASAKAELLSAPTSAVKPVESPAMSDQPRWTVIASGIFMAVGSLLPWAQSGIFTVAGTRGDGVLTLVLGGIAAIVGIAKRDSAAIVVIVCGGLGALIAGQTIGRLESAVVGGGLYLTMIASVVLAFAGIDMYRDRRTSRAAG